ncbi:hypothetical protein, partial [Salinimicrobium oceani]|uniref:hypothetical protein n=1 Tax=Salinimicrobium oceani TaxID=2722702 RepID=UPI001ADDB384
WKSRKSSVQCSLVSVQYLPRYTAGLPRNLTVEDFGPIAKKKTRRGTIILALGFNPGIKKCPLQKSPGRGDIFAIAIKSLFLVI